MPPPAPPKHDDTLEKVAPLDRAAGTSDLATSPVVGRYAPSPTGPLHLGNLRTALAAWLAARAAGGSFLMRIEDNDFDRTREGAEAACFADLRWLGLDWDGEVTRQSDRLAIYHDVLARLAERGVVYACSCSRRDLAEAGAPHGPAGVIYPGTCRDQILGASELPPARTPGAAPGPPAESAVRLRLGDATISFGDRIAGAQRVDLASEVGDQVVLRRDGLWAYQFACAVDDALSGVTQVVRGDDLLSSTAPQIAIQRAVGLAPPTEWIHLPLMADAATGKRLAKRDGAASIDAWRDGERITPAEARGRLAASLGLLERAEPVSLEELLPLWKNWLSRTSRR